MNGEIVTLIIYGCIAVMLALGGIYTLRKGFQLIVNGSGKNVESSSIKFLGLQVTTGSIGALVMMTAFMWAWAAKLSLPQYHDGKVQITALTKKLSLANNQLGRLKVSQEESKSQLIKLNTDYKSYVKKVEKSHIKWSRLLASASNSPTSSISNNQKNNFKTILKQQKVDLKNFKITVGAQQ